MLKILTSILFKLSSSDTFVRHGIRSTAAVMVEPPCPLDVVATENCSIDDLVPFVHSSLVLRRNKILILCSALACNVISYVIYNVLHTKMKIKIHITMRLTPVIIPAIHEFLLFWHHFVTILVRLCLNLF